jgi:cell division protein FtsB
LKQLIIIFSVLLIALQIKLWAGSGGVRDIARLSEGVSVQRELNAALAERNHTLTAEVHDLKQGNAAVEERARAELGMVKQDETFYQVITR